jgi:hypothetical protein
MMSDAVQPVSSVAPARRTQRRVALCLILALLLGPWFTLSHAAAEPLPAEPAAATTPCHGAPEAPPAAAGQDCCDDLCWHCALCGPASALPLQLFWRHPVAHDPVLTPRGVGRLARGHPDTPYRPPSRRFV